MNVSLALKVCTLWSKTPVNHKEKKRPNTHNKTQPNQQTKQTNKQKLKLIPDKGSMVLMEKIGAHQEDVMKGF